MITPNDTLAENIRSLKVGNNEKEKLINLNTIITSWIFKQQSVIEQISKLGVIIERKKKLPRFIYNQY